MWSYLTGPRVITVPHSSPMPQKGTGICLVQLGHGEQRQSEPASCRQHPTYQMTVR
jgi:hypothetical protein